MIVSRLTPPNRLLNRTANALSCVVRTVSSKHVGLKMPSTHSITLSKSGQPMQAVLTQSEVRYEGSRPVCELALAFCEHTYSASGTDYFEALIALRQQLEPTGVLFHINGASRNVWPSGMSRSMSLGLKAYRMRMGKQALLQHIVNTLDVDSDIEPVTVSEQEKFRNVWLASFGRGET